MVSSTNQNNCEPSPSNEIEGIPPGDYQLVGWDMDSTGKILSDEICQIAGYTPQSTFSQYVMPFKNLTQSARKRYNLKIVTIGRYRMLKNSKTNKVIQTKSEISAIMEFLDWLETVKNDAKDGIILVYHESVKVNIPILLETLIKHKLFERFKKTVKGFVNGFDVATSKCVSRLPSFSLRTLTRVLLNLEEQYDNAVNRARLALQIIQHLSNSEENIKVNMNMEGSDITSKATVEFVREFVQPTEAEEREYRALKLVLERQNSLKPIFKSFLQPTRIRLRTSPLSRLLAEANIDYIQLKNVWFTGQEVALVKLIKENVNKATEKEIVDLLVIIESHFDPTKKPEIKVEYEQKKISSKRSQVKSKSKDISSSDASPDTTTVCSPIKEINQSPGFIMLLKYFLKFICYIIIIRIIMSAGK